MAGRSMADAMLELRRLNNRGNNFRGEPILITPQVVHIQQRNRRKIRNLPKEFRTNPYLLHFYKRFQKRGLPHENCCEHALGIETKRQRWHEQPNWEPTPNLQINYHQTNDLMAEFDVYLYEGLPEDMMKEIMKEQAESGTREARLREQRQPIDISAGELTIEHGEQYSHLSNNLSHHQHELVRLIEASRVEATKKNKDSVFGSTVGEALTSGAGRIKVDTAISSLMSRNQITIKTRMLNQPTSVPYQVLQRQAMPVDAQGIPSNLTKAEVDAVTAHIHQRALERLQTNINKLWKKAENNMIELPSGFIQADHGLVKIEKLIDVKYVDKWINEIPEKMKERSEQASELLEKEVKRRKDGERWLKSELTEILDLNGKISETALTDARAGKESFRFERAVMASFEARVEGKKSVEGKRSKSVILTKRGAKH